MPLIDDPLRNPGRKYFESPAGTPAASPGVNELATPAANTFQGRPVDMTAGSRLNTVPAQGAAMPTGSGRNPFEIAGDAVNLVNNASYQAQGRINSAHNPMSDDAETIRRLEISQGGFKGSPRARGAMAEAYLGQLGASRAAALQPMQPTAILAGQAAGAENRSNEQAVDGAQRMALQELVGTQQTGLETLRQTSETGRNSADNLAAIDVAKIGRNPVGAYQQAADGTLALVEGATASTVTGADGKPFAATARDGITAKDRFDAYQKRAEAIQTGVMTPEQKQAQLLLLQQSPEFASLFAAPGQSPGQGTPSQPAAPPQNAQQFITAARAQGSKMSDAELTAYFNNKYGKSAP